MRRRTFKQLERWIQGLGSGFAPLLASAAGGPVDPRLAARTLGDPQFTAEAGAQGPEPAAREGSPDPSAPTGPDGAAGEPGGSAPGPPRPPAEPLADLPPGGEEEARPGRHRRLAGKVKKGLVSVVASSYDARADDLEERAVRAMRKALVDERSHILEVAREMYDARADDLQTRAVASLRRLFEDEHHRMLEFVQRSYDSRADDLEERAVRAMRSAVQREADRIESLIEHSVHVKRREVRLSLLVLVVANLIYLLVYWLTGAGG